LKFLLIFILSFTHSLAFTYTGKLLNSLTLSTLVNAKVFDSNTTVYSDQNGTFSLQSNQSKIFVKAYGYRPFSISKDDNLSVYKVTPIKVKALYLNYWGARENSKTFKRILKAIDETEINSVVIDIKSAYGLTNYKTSYTQANAFGIWYQRNIKDIQSFMNILKSKNIYTIARLATFKDELQAFNHPEYAVKDTNGEIWRNFDDIAWVDPYDKRSHIYTVSIAKDAAKIGFDEINFDFIRFPARQGLVYSKENTQTNRVKAIEDFLFYAKNELKQYGVFISVDTYGLLCWNKDDSGIGQTLKGLSKHSDYISPMLYPSGFTSEYFKVQYPSDHPHMVIHKSINNIVDEIDPKRLRPWLQHFKDYAHTKRFYSKKDISEQIRACDDHNTTGWMMWSPSSRYKQHYFEPTIKDGNLSQSF